METAARDFEAQAAVIDAAVFDVRAINPNTVATVDIRTRGQIIANIEAKGQIVANALVRLSALMHVGSEIHKSSSRVAHCKVRRWLDVYLGLI
jgi:type I restriction enzyme M protein